MSPVGLALCVLTLGVSLVLVAKNFMGFEQMWSKFRNFSFVYGAAFSVIILCASYGAACSTGSSTTPRDRDHLLQLVSRAFHRDQRSERSLRILLVSKLIALPWSPVEPLRFALSFVITFFVAIALYLAVEKPFMKLSRTFLQTRKRAVPATA